MDRIKSTALPADEKLTVLVTSDGLYGFIGKSARVEKDMVVLENALTIGYTIDGEPRLGFNQIPLGMLNPDETTETSIPVKNVSYCVSFDAKGSHALSEMYTQFFKDLIVPPIPPVQ